MFNLEILVETLHAAGTLAGYGFAF